MKTDRAMYDIMRGINHHVRGYGLDSNYLYYPPVGVAHLADNIEAFDTTLDMSSRIVRKRDRENLEYITLSEYEEMYKDESDDERTAKAKAHYGVKISSKGYYEDYYEDSLQLFNYIFENSFSTREKKLFSNMNFQLYEHCIYRENAEEIKHLDVFGNQIVITTESYVNIYLYNELLNALFLIISSKCYNADVLIKNEELTKSYISRSFVDHMYMLTKKKTSIYIILRKYFCYLGCLKFRNDIKFIFDNKLFGNVVGCQFNVSLNEHVLESLRKFNNFFSSIFVIDSSNNIFEIYTSLLRQKNKEIFYESQRHIEICYDMMLFFQILISGKKNKSNILNETFLLYLEDNMSDKKALNKLKGYFLHTEYILKDKYKLAIKTFLYRLFLHYNRMIYFFKRAFHLSSTANTFNVFNMPTRYTNNSTGTTVNNRSTDIDGCNTPNGRCPFDMFLLDLKLNVFEKFLKLKTYEFDLNKSAQSVYDTIYKEKLNRSLRFFHLLNMAKNYKSYQIKCGSSLSFVPTSEDKKRNQNDKDSGTENSDIHFRNQDYSLYNIYTNNMIHALVNTEDTKKCNWSFENKEGVDTSLKKQNSYDNDDLINSEEFQLYTSEDVVDLEGVIHDKCVLKLYEHNCLFEKETLHALKEVNQWRIGELKNVKDVIVNNVRKDIFYNIDYYHLIDSSLHDDKILDYVKSKKYFKKLKKNSLYSIYYNFFIFISNNPKMLYHIKKYLHFHSISKSLLKNGTYINIDLLKVIFYFDKEALAELQLMLTFFPSNPTLAEVFRAINFLVLPFEV